MNPKLAKRLFLSSTTCCYLKQSIERQTRNASQYFQVERQKRYAILKLNKPPVNSFNLDMFIQLSEQLNEFERDETLNGVILTSV
jgi:hypothetical protein